jgi:hypothetical protein
LICFNPICMNPGHSSWSAAGLGFLSWALLDLLSPLDGGGHVWRLVLGWLPAMGACAVGVTRWAGISMGLDGWPRLLAKLTREGSGLRVLECATHGRLCI